MIFFVTQSVLKIRCYLYSVKNMNGLIAVIQKIVPVPTSIKLVLSVQTHPPYTMLIK